MHFSLLGTFDNNEEMAEAVRELHGKQELE